MPFEDDQGPEWISSKEGLDPTEPSHLVGFRSLTRARGAQTEPRLAYRPAATQPARRKKWAETAGPNATSTSPTPGHLGRPPRSPNPSTHSPYLPRPPSCTTPRACGPGHRSGNNRRLPPPRSRPAAPLGPAQLRTAPSAPGDGTGRGGPVQRARLCAQFHWLPRPRCSATAHVLQDSTLPVTDGSPHSFERVGVAPTVPCSPLLTVSRLNWGSRTWTPCIALCK
jgi:hypothetical protein